MKPFVAALACCMIVIAMWSLMKLTSAILIGIAIYLLWCTILGYFLKMRDNQVVILRSIATHNAAVLLEIKKLKEAK